MRRGFGLISLVVTAILLAIVGVIAYNVGWSDGVATHLPAGAAVPPPDYYGYGYGPHWGFGIFGFFWFLFVLFIIFALLRFAFFGRRHWGGGWGYKGGPGYGMPHGIDERMQEWHKRAHGEQPPASGSTPPPPPPPDQRTV
jgi:hypothetical protein